MDASDWAIREFAIRLSLAAGGLRSVTWMNVVFDL